MATKTPNPPETRSPLKLRYSAKPHHKFVCTDCFREIEGWAYEVGFDSMGKRNTCAFCWAQPRIPPMRPVGTDIILG